MTMSLFNMIGSTFELIILDTTLALRPQLSRSSSRANAYSAQLPWFWKGEYGCLSCFLTLNRVKSISFLKIKHKFGKHHN